MIRNFLLFIFIFVSCFGISQNGEWKFDGKSIESGLSNTYVSNIIKDSKGFVWAATTNGLNRYNAYLFEVFKNDPENPNSISSDITNCIIEDESKQIWVGTDNGLNRYDNATGKFTSWLPDTLSNSPQFIHTIIEDHKGNLWLGTAKGVYIFNLEKEIFHLLDIGKWNVKNYSTSNFVVRTMIMDKDWNIWVGTNGYGILRYSISNDFGEIWRNDMDALSTININYCFALCQDDAGDIWAGTYIGGLSKFDTETNSFRNIHNPNNPKATTKNGVMSIADLGQGELLIGTNGGGLFFFDSKEEKFIKNYRFNPNDQHSIGDDFIAGIFIDETGIVWLGTENAGISVYDPNRRKFDLFQKTENKGNSLPGNIINTIYEDENGVLWIGTENNGYSKFDRSKNRYENFKIDNVKTVNGNTFIKTIISDRNGGVWIGGHMSGLAHIDSYGRVMHQFSPNLQPNNPNHLNDSQIRALFLDKDNTLWIGTYRGLSKKIENNFINYCGADEWRNYFCLDPVTSILDFDNTYLIVGYQYTGIRFFNKKTNTFESSFHSENSNLSNSHINSLCLDTKGQLWIGTAKGLNQFNWADSTFTNYRKKDGLPDDNILEILEDNEGDLWISTSFGLSRFNLTKNTFQNYYEADGLQSSVFRVGAAYKSKNGELFFGGVGGFNAFFPNQLKSNPNPPPIVFTNFYLFNKAVIAGDKSPLKIHISEIKKIELDYNQSTLSFEFAALNYTLSERNEYAYMLEGQDEEWSYIGTRRHITFTNIDPGAYVLRVKACNNDGVWNEEGVAIEIIIYPPFWETWWFRLLMIVIGVLIIYTFYKWRVRAIKNQNKLLEKEVEIRTKQVVDQKNEITSQKDLVEKKNNDITASIRYSKRIQDSFLPNLKEIENYFDTSFVFFSPKDIVSGDFYWFNTVKESGKILLAVGDCTGHGVPGAMVSILGNNGLDRSVKELNFTQPNLILDNLNVFIKNVFDKKDSNVQDGMDISLCAIDTKTKMLEFSGANNPIWIARAGEMILIKGTKQPIGKYRDSKHFEQKEFQLETNDWVFLFSDGFPDQFGGPKGKKFKYTQFQQTLLRYNPKEDADFSTYLEKTFKDWKGDLEQLDDVCVLGVKIK